MKLYEILPNGYLGSTTEVADDIDGIPPGFTDTAPDTEVPEHQWLYWIGSGWVLTSVDPSSLVTTISVAETSQAVPQAGSEVSATSNSGDISQDTYTDAVIMPAAEWPPEYLGEQPQGI